jgi:putative serine protease PepD
VPPTTAGANDTAQFSPVPGNGAPGWPAASTSTIEKPRKQRGMGTVVAAALIAGIVGGGAGFGGAYALLGDGSSGTSLTQSPASGASNAATTVPGSVAAAAAKATPSTVDIQVSLAQGTAEGSGVILTADGDVLTNNHVVAGNTGTITVTLADGSEHQAKVVGTSPSYDLAVIKLQNVSGLTPAALGESSSVQVGQQVVAIGSPQGLTGTVTTGIVSAFNRTVAVQGESGGAAVVYNGLQTDAPINQGNSGGPLVNLDGQVIGINSAIATGSSQSTGSIGLGFAIPVDQAKRVAQEIIQTGSATKPVLGVQGSVGGQSVGTGGGGATVSGVQGGSPAATAGLKAGDIVTKVGDAKVEDFSDLVARIGSYAPGQEVTLTVNSGGTTKTVQVTLGSQADKAASTSTGGEDANPFGGSNGGSPFGNLIPFGGGGN